MLAACVVDHCGREEVKLPATVHRPKALLTGRVAIIRIQPPHQPPCKNSSVQLVNGLLKANGPPVCRVITHTFLVE